MGFETYFGLYLILMLDYHTSDNPSAISAVANNLTNRVVTIFVPDEQPNEKKTDVAVSSVPNIGLKSTVVVDLGRFKWWEGDTPNGTVSACSDVYDDNYLDAKETALLLAKSSLSYLEKETKYYGQSSSQLVRYKNKTKMTYNIESSEVISGYLNDVDLLAEVIYKGGYCVLVKNKSVVAY